MGGIVLYAYFLFIGFLYADMLFKEKDIYFRGWMGGIFGNVILMMGIVPIACILKFSLLSHIILALLAAVPYVVIKLRKKDRKIISINIKEGEEYISNKIFLCLILPITVVIGVLLTNHILAPTANGVASGQCTYGDLQMHLSFVTSIAEQQSFPPEYSLLSGTTLNYPFFVDMLSSSLYQFGLPLRWAVLIPSYIISLLLVTGFYIVAYSITKKKSAAVLATVFFFLNGGFGFAYFFEGAKADSTAFTKIFTDYYHTPTNFNENNIRWANTICDMIIPQRTTMAGWCMILPTLWLLIDAVKTKRRERYIEIGVLAGCMPMIHTHSFLALGMISAVMFFAYLYKEEDRKSYIINWVIFGGIVLVMAFPQLMYWTFRQTSGNESFLKYTFNWVNEKDPYLWFYLKNWGIMAIFAVPAFLYASKDNKKLLGGGILIFVISEFILFQPNPYDNNKLFFIAYMLVVMLVSDYLIYLFEKLKGVRGRAFLAVLVIAAGTLSGILTIGREYKSGAQYQTFSNDDIEFADYIKENTEPDAVFLTGTGHLNPVAVLAGRTIYVGSSLYVHFHGMGNEFTVRENNVKKALSGSYEDMKKLCEENGITYVYVGSNERSMCQVNEQMLSRLEKVYSQGNNTLYKVK